MTIDPDKILAIDDEPAVLNVIRDTLAEDGIVLRTANNNDEAMTALDEGDWAVVLLDQRLHGAAGADEGLGLVAEIERRSPGAKTIVVTGYASPQAIEQAFAAGVYDYVEKTQNFATLLRAKVRNATELAREQRLAAIAPSAVSAILRDLWQQAKTESHPGRKLDRFTNKLERRFGRAKLGFFVAANGFTSGFGSTLVTRRREDLLVVPVDATALETLINASDLDQALKQLHQRAIEAANG